MINLTTAEQQAYCEAANALKGNARRQYMAGVVQALGRGGQRYAERTFGWNRRTVRKGLAELTSGICQPGERIMNCPHIDQIQAVTPSAEGCEDCLKTGDSWVHLRICLICGHVGCCDSSPNRHATKHFHATNHPIIQSFEPGEDWRWCFVDKRVV